MQPHKKHFVNLLIPEDNNNSDFQVIWARNIYLLLLKILFSRNTTVPRGIVARVLLTGLLVELGIYKPKPKTETQIMSDSEDLPF